ncbi:MAG: hypothetical protein L3K09_02565 [Thermoplasmata archaeon]|nr:hypothetical protein [Thermoplasmata archaeon]
MIQATARVLENVVEIKVGEEVWICRPVGSSSPELGRRIAALFSTVYETFRSSEPSTVYSTVSYHAKRDEIIVQIGEEKWRTVSSVFGPMTYQYGGITYAIHEKLTGKFAILQGSTVVATGELGFRSCTIRDSPADLEGFLTNIALGYLIRTLVWEIFR